MRLFLGIVMLVEWVVYGDGRCWFPILMNAEKLKHINIFSMKLRNICIAVLGVSSLSSMAVWAQPASDKPAEGYVFTIKRDLPVTSVKNQQRSGTCWSYATLALLEADLLRQGKPAVDLSPMFVVRQTYLDKADRYVRFQGTISFSGGGSSGDVMNTIRDHGIVPMEVYMGLNYGTDQHVHGELDAVTEAYVSAIVKNPNRKLSSAWKRGFQGIVDAYLGPLPERFSHNGQQYTPREFAKHLGINVEDYIEISSFSHHPFYSKFVLEVPDNWVHDAVYNVPLAEFEAIIDYALDNGFPIGWGSDVSEDGFSWKNGLAIVPDVQSAPLDGSDMARWTKMSNRERSQAAFERPGRELSITQEIRQAAFDNQQTTDDHGMLIVGTAHDQNGNIYYKVKNSWGEAGKYNGYFYASKPFVLYKTLTIMLHKDGIPRVIREKLGVK